MLKCELSKGHCFQCLPLCMGEMEPGQLSETLSHKEIMKKNILKVQLKRQLTQTPYCLLAL